MMPQHKRRVKWIIGGALLVVGLLVALIWLLANRPAPAADHAAPEFPQPVTPLSGGYFVDSALILQWDWPPALEKDQVFAVRIWYGDESPREIWTTDRQLDAQAHIDSYAQEIGPYAWQVALINLNDEGGFARMGSAWSPVQAIHRVRRISPTPLPEAQRSAAARLVSAQPFDSTSALIGWVRHFVSTNSSGTAQDAFAADYHDALDMITAHAQGEGPLPDLLCDGQATAMLTLLGELGIESRLIFLYGDNYDQIQEHTLLEVFNAETQVWELHDVLSDRYFVDENRDPASIERLVFGDLDLVSICDSEDSCARFGAADYDFRTYFEAFRYGYSDTFWVNPDRFDLAKRFPTNANRNLAEYLTGNPRDFVFRLDNWNKQP